jgi:hypothetical protein
VSSNNSEKQLRRRGNNLMKKLDWHPISVENDAYPGTPDTNFVYGWIEYKCCSEWPKRGGPLRIPHFTAQQRVWLRTRWRATGSGYGAWLWLQVGQDHLIFDGETASIIVGNQNKRVLLQHALAHWDRFPTEEELAGVILV